MKYPGHNQLGIAMRKVKVVIRGLRSIMTLLLPARLGQNQDGLDLSLTSYGNRLIVVGVAIASFCQGSSAVRNIYLTVDDEEKLTVIKRFFLNILKAKGVIILRGTRRGPHSKYWYYLHTVWDGKRSFMLIDDDVIYERGIADLLFEGAKMSPFNVCVRSLKFQVEGDVAMPYKSWPTFSSRHTGRSVFATNVGGVVIESSFAHKLIELNERYQDHCRNADDIWFHWVSVEYDMPYTQVHSEFKNPTPIPFTQGGGLSNTVNVSGNDVSIRGLYSPEVLSRIAG